MVTGATNKRMHNSFENRVTYAMHDVLCEAGVDRTNAVSNKHAILEN